MKRICRRLRDQLISPLSSNLQTVREVMVPVMMVWSESWESCKMKSLHPDPDSGSASLPKCTRKTGWPRNCFCELCGLYVRTALDEIPVLTHGKENSTRKVKWSLHLVQCVRLVRISSIKRDKLMLEGAKQSSNFTKPLVNILVRDTFVHKKLLNCVRIFEVGWT